MAITRTDTGVPLSTSGLPITVNNQLIPIPPLTGVVTTSVLGTSGLWPSDSITNVPDLIITAGT